MSRTGEDVTKRSGEHEEPFLSDCGKYSCAVTEVVVGRLMADARSSRHFPHGKRIRTVSSNDFHARRKHLAPHIHALSVQLDIVYLRW
jgi:hypothetical protein